MLTFAQLRKLQLGGFADTAALLAVGAGGMATHPGTGMGSLSLGIAAGAGLAALGGGWVGKRIGETVHLDAIDDVSLRLNSSPPLPAHDEGMHLGFICDTGQPLVIPPGEWSRHMMITGQSGVGKTVILSWMMFQQIVRGGGLLWIDGKLDPDNIDLLWAMASWCGRQDDLLIINPGDPANSNTYNPILFGDPDEVASRLLSLLPSTEDNAGADYYRQAANQGLTTLIAAVQATGLAYNFADLGTLLMNDRALQWLEQRVPYGSDAQRALSMFMYQFKSANQKTGQQQIDLKKLKDTFGGIGGRLNLFGSGSFGRILNSYSPEVRLKEAVQGNKIIYVALPTMAKNEAASNFGKLVIGDFRSAIAQIQALPKHQRPDPPFLGIFDEAGSYVTQAWSRMFEQARSARLVMVPAFQTKANLEVIGEELRAMVSGNTLTKAHFKPGEPDTAEWQSEMIGKERQVDYTVSSSRGIGLSKKTAVSRSPDGVSDNGSTGFTESVKEDYKVAAGDLLKLGKGETIIQFDGSQVFHIKTPLLEFTPLFYSTIGKFSVNRRRVQRTRGLDFLANAEKFIGTVGGDE